MRRHEGSVGALRCFLAARPARNTTGPRPRPMSGGMFLVGNRGAASGRAPGMAGAPASVFYPAQPGDAAP